jgi:DNA-directed RNA polymerase specialized sigma24 family protein
MLAELDLYRAEFDEIVDTVYQAYERKPLQSGKPYLISLYDSVSQFEPCYPLERADVSQELVFRWLIFIQKYYEAKPAITLKQYLIRRSIWTMRDWFKLLMRKPPYETPIVILPKLDSFVLNSKFLLYGTDVQPFDCLTSYERYLLFLKFKDDRTILEIADAVQKTKKTVRTQLKRIYNKLRSYEDASTEPGRPCERSDGSPS